MAKKRIKQKKLKQGKAKLAGLRTAPGVLPRAAVPSASDPKGKPTETDKARAQLIQDKMNRERSAQAEIEAVLKKYRCKMTVLEQIQITAKV